MDLTIIKKEAEKIFKNKLEVVIDLDILNLLNERNSSESYICNLNLRESWVCVRRICSIYFDFLGENPFCLLAVPNQVEKVKL